VLTYPDIAMARYLTPEWIDALASAADGLEGPPGVRLTVQQRVTGGPDGDVSYHVVLEEGKVAVRAGEAAAPDVTFVQDHATAVAVACGELAAQAAFMSGRMRVTGDVQRLIDEKDALTGLDRVLAGVRAETEYA
jgi:alkyl sulfatase BDS1-like metallo-beta-lactamase superfamily hydrolase